MKVLKGIARIMVGVLLSIIGFLIATTSLMESQSGLIKMILFIILFGISYGMASFLCFGKQLNDIFLYFPVACILGMIVWILVIIFSLFIVFPFNLVDRWILTLGFLWCAVTIICKSQYPWFHLSVKKENGDKL